ncbi:cytochrome d ubiquinol oxidase subunit II [Natronococcus jeotgali]|uniref:Cytochrome d ubiquinol oxidase subunit 2 n=1 Tax=Natronococcus jeotgali DSM 18795 TaxID=1227498 RepID=L9XCF0_9EURY|nr:cytochrome d ubiquinol oxidase subunit II [Natronococcus jeotgali]ELY59317.1 cytochrome d ubiquinol oxidase subunit 2 [Natronococcus jeotgali DSM 18795]
MTEVALAEVAFLPVDQYLHPLLPMIWFSVVLFCLTMYVALDGFDFGIGILYATRTDEDDRETLLSAFGPIWDANEVWIVAFGTTLLAAFPPVYSRLLSDHYLLSLAIVIALIFRGVAPELREHRDNDQWKRTCDRLFVAGSTLAPILLGALVGSWVFASGMLGVPSLLTSLVVVCLSVTSGAAFLAMKTQGRLRVEVRRYGIAATVAYLLAVAALLSVVFTDDSASVRDQLLAAPAPEIIGLTVVISVVGVLLARHDRARLWFGSTLTLSGLLGSLVAVLLFPTIYPAGGYTIEETIVSPLALNLVTVLGLPVLVFVLWYFKFLYGVFQGPIEEGGYGH